MNCTKKCPVCHLADQTAELSTMNEWKYYCSRCDVRFNEDHQLEATDIV